MRRVKRTSPSLDLDLLEAARSALGTEGVSETIDCALRESITAAARRRTIAMLADPDRLDLFDEELERQAWGDRDLPPP
jgi:hypothetical protein